MMMMTMMTMLLLLYCYPFNNGYTYGSKERKLGFVESAFTLTEQRT